MNIAIVDDEKKEAEALSSIIKEYSFQNKLDISLSCFAGAEEFLQSCHPYAYTAIFMDIYMEGMTGIEAATELLKLDRRALIIFLTSSNEHMGEAFSIHAYDYIEKPAKKERLFKVLDDIMLLNTEVTNTPRFSFSSNKKEISVPYPDIVYIRTSAHNYLEIMDSSGGVYLTRLTFSVVSDLLSKDPRFLIIMRGVLVNMDFINKMENGSCEMNNGIRLSVNVKNAKKLDTTWQNYRLDCLRAERKTRRELR